MQNPASFFFTTVLAVALLLLGCEKKSNIPSPQDQMEIMESTEAHTEAFNVHDSDKLTSLWDEDGLFINLTTEEMVEGNKNIAAFFRNLFEKKGAKNIKMVLSSVSSSEDNEALAQGILEVSFADQYTWKGAFKAEYRKHDGKWFIHSLSVNEINSSQTQFEHLKELDWLAGNWIDAENPVEVEYSNLWDNNKNFLVQNFTFSVLGQEELKGMQIIGWNPAEKKICSWTFNSDGGYGTGIWSKNGNTWIVKQEFILPRGGKATSTHTYSVGDVKSYSFSDTNRIADGKKLPNIGPFKIIRN